ncbi:hypothetical protein RKD55_004575 [Rossellomorea marisflavi]
MDRQEKIDKVLQHQVEREFMLDHPTLWKKVVLLHFNQIYRKEIGMRELIQLMKEKGVSSERFSDTLWKYPITELLEFIADLSGISDLNILPHMKQRFYLMDTTKTVHGKTLVIMDTFKGAQLRIKVSELENLEPNELYTEEELRKLRDDIRGSI